jgi:hypothetical protein
MSEQSTPAPAVYKEVPGFPGYRVGDDGSVWSCKPRNGRGGLLPTWRRLKCRISRRYLCVGIRGPDGVKRVHTVHSLVLEAFVGPRPDGLWALHRDDNRADNTLPNLYWGTPSDNAIDRRENGHSNYARGAALPQTILDEDLVAEMRRLRRSGATLREIAERFGVTEGAAGSACKGRSWKHVAEGAVVGLKAFPVNTHCKNGHPLEGDNLRVTAKGHRKCRECGRQAKQRERLRDPEKFRERCRQWYAKRSQS